MRVPKVGQSLTSFWALALIQLTQKMLYTDFREFLRFPGRYAVLHSSTSQWCTVSGTEVTCGGSGTLTSAAVRSAGAYTEYTKAVVLEGILALRNSCFASCNRLTEVELATTVALIESHAFDGCSIPSFRLHFNLTSMHPSAFNNQNKLTNIDVDDANPSYCSVDGMLLTKDKKTIVIIPGGWTSCTIPSSVMHLSAECCKWSLMETIDIPDNVVSIGNGAFYLSQKLTYMSIGAGLASFGYDALNSCSKLAKIDLDPRNTNFYNENGVFGAKDANGVKHSILFISKETESTTVQSTITIIGPTVFQNAEKLCEITDQGGRFTSPDNKILVENGTHLCACGGGAEHVEIPDTITVVMNDAFRGSKNLKSVVFGKNIHTPGFSSFRDCAQLTHFDWNGCVAEYVASHMFSDTDLSGIENFTLPTSMKIIYDHSFVGSQIKGISAPNVETIYDEAFGPCNRLERVYLPKVVSIAASAFRGCDALREVIFGTPSTLKTIGSMAFAYCKSLKSIDIPETLTNLLPQSFAYCASLTTINAKPGNYQSVDGVVYNKDLDTIILCPSGLETITLISTTKSLGSNSFYGCTKLSSVLMNDAIERLESWSFTDCSVLATIHLPSNLSYIAPDALSGCPSLRQVFYCNKHDIAECESDPFSEKTNVYVSEDYESSDGLFCHHPCMKVLDVHCNMPTCIFTPGFPRTKPVTTFCYRMLYLVAI